jgi:hypothetical protein
LQGCDQVQLCNLDLAGYTVPGASLVSITDALKIEIRGEWHLLKRMAGAAAVSML